MRRTVPPRIVLAACMLLFPTTAAAVRVAYLYTLSDFSGPVPYNDVKLHADRIHDEVYAIVGNSVRVFNASGMQVHAFDLDPRFGTLFDLAVEDSGDLLLLTLSFAAGSADPGWSITRCDYRGQPTGRMDVTGLPKELAAFRPSVLIRRDDGIVLASPARYQAVSLDRSGAFRRAYDLANLIGMKEADRSKNDIAAFGMDRHGNMLLTVPTMFRAFVISPEGKVRDFGHAGSAPGAFGVVAGIVADDRDNLIVADKGRGVVMVFDPSFEFQKEFGAGGGGPSGLVRPTDLALGPSGKLYVTQARDRGVAVFLIDGNEESPGSAAPEHPDRAGGPRPPSFRAEEKTALWRVSAGPDGD